MFPREGGMMLYKRLVRDQDESNLYQIRKVIHSSERERKRALLVLGVLSKGKSLQFKKEKNVLHEKISKPKTKNKESIMKKAHNFQARSPYMRNNTSTNLERDKKSLKIIKSPFDFKHIPPNGKQYKSETSKKIVAPNDYIWHPPFYSDRKVDKRRKKAISSSAMGKVVSMKSSTSARLIHM
jgi:hypothetical protein